MQPKQNTHRQQYPGGKYVTTYRFEDESEPQDLFYDNTANNDDDLFHPMDDFDFDSLSTFEEANIQINPNTTGDDEKRRIEAIKRAIDIAKLMDNVNIQNILDIAEQVDKYLKS